MALSPNRHLATSLGAALGAALAAALAAASGTLAGCAEREPAPEGSAAPAHADDRPPVLLVVVDTLRADHLGAYGYDRPTSPRLDAFASTGILFERCVAQSSWTKPATATILTGRYPAEHGANQTGAVIVPEAQPLAGLLQEHGYRTAAFVTNPLLGVPFGFARGFDTYVSFSPHEAPPGYERAEGVVDAALDWIAGAAGEPFFAYLHLMDPHAPYDPPPPFGEPFERPYEGDVTGYVFRRPDEGLPGPEDREHLIDLYDGEIAYVDHHFGRLLDGLAELGLDERCVVVFTSDHGEEFFDHGGWQHDARLFEETLRVPLLLRAPFAGVRAGTRSAAPAAQIDIAPTIAAAVAAGVPGDLPGRDLLQGLGPEGVEVAPRILVSEVDHDGAYRKALRSGELKYVRSWSPTSHDAFFDLAEDPLELDDRSKSDPRAASLRAALRDYLQHTASGYTVAVRNGSEESLEVVVAIESAEPLPRFEPFFTEQFIAADAEDFPLGRETLDTPEGQRTVSSFHFDLPPGDADGLRFDAAPTEGELRLAAFVEGHMLRPENVTLGAEGQHPTELPLTFDRVESRAWTAPVLTPLAGPAPGSVELLLWRNSGAAASSVQVSDEVRANLEALGYTVSSE